MSKDGTDQMSAQGFLEYLQALQAKRTARPETKVSERPGLIMEVAEHFNGPRKTWKRDYAKELADALTTAESESTSSNPYLVGNLERLLHEAARINTEGGFPTLPCDMALGTLPTGQVNACAIRAPRGGVVIAINEGLPAFLVRMTSIVTPVVQDWADGDVEKGLSHLDRGGLGLNALHFIDALAEFVAHKSIDRSSVYHRAGKHTQLGALLFDTALMFVVAHEYAHLMLNHVPEAGPKGRVIESIEVEELPRSWQQELDADKFGLLTTLSYNGSKDFRFLHAYLGIDVLFSFFSVVEQTIGAVEPGSHPPSTMRQRAMREFVVKHCRADPERDLVPGILIESVMQDLWNSFRAYVLRAARSTRWT